MNYGANINFRGKEFLAWYLPEEESVLDVGCGNGLLFKAIYDKIVLPLKQDEPFTIPQYKGIDLSYKMLEGAKELYPEQEWEVGDANDIKEEDESWDNVILFHILECMEDYEQPIKEALRVAKNKVVIAMWKGLRVQDTDVIKESPPNNWESMFSGKRFFPFLAGLGYTYPQWVELYVESTRYNLFIIIDKKHKRAEISHL